LHSSSASPTHTRKHQRPLTVGGHHSFRDTHADFGRLWCVYELATFCRDHPKELDHRLLLFSLEWESSLASGAGRLKSEITEEEQAWFRGFRCYAVQCAKPADRAFVLGEIRRNWGAEANFDRFVRTVLPLVLARSKERYTRQTRRIMSEALSMLFGH
jgi:hypothetical protein